MLAKYLARFEETVICIFFVRQFCFPTEQEKNLLQWLNKHWNTTCSEYVHAGCVTHAKNTTGLSKASNHAIKSHTNPVKLGVLRVLWQFKNYSTIQNHWEPKRAENTVKKTKKTKLWATCDYLPSLFAFCSLFLWGFAGGGPGPDPKGFLQYTSPIYWSWVPACDMWNQITQWSWVY